MLRDDKNIEFYFLQNFHDMRCKYDRVHSIIRQQMNREPLRGEAYIMMSSNRRTVRIYRYDDKSCTLHEKRFCAGFKFMKIVHEGDKTMFRINWKDVRKILQCPVIKSLRVK